MPDHERRPYYHWYPRDFIASYHVRVMTYEEQGVYRALLDLQWMEGGVPADLGLMASILRIPRHRMVAIWQKIGCCFKPVEDDPSTLRQSRLEKVRTQMVEASQRRQESGRKGGEAKAKRVALQEHPFREENVPKSSSNATAMVEQSSSIATAMVEQRYSNGVAVLKQWGSTQTQTQTHTNESKDSFAADATTDIDLSNQDIDEKDTPAWAKESEVETKTSKNRLTSEKPKRVRVRSERDQAADRITNTLGKLIKPHIGKSMTQEDWRKQNHLAALALHDAGNSVEELIAAWTRLNQKDGKSKHVNLHWLQVAMAEDASKHSLASSPVKTKRGWIDDQPYEGPAVGGLISMKPDSWSDDEGDDWYKRGVLPEKFRNDRKGIAS
jgi:hypothetical protein